MAKHRMESSNRLFSSKQTSAEKEAYHASHGRNLEVGIDTPQTSEALEQKSFRDRTNEASDRIVGTVEAAQSRKSEFSSNSARRINNLAEKVEATGGLRSYALNTLRKIGGNAARAVGRKLNAGIDRMLMLDKLEQIISPRTTENTADTTNQSVEKPKAKTVARSEIAPSTKPSPIAEITPKSNTEISTPKSSSETGENTSTPAKVAKHRATGAGVGNLSPSTSSGNFAALGSIDTGNERWDAILGNNRKKAEQKAKKALERRQSRQLAKEGRMLERRKNWAELKDKIGKKWYARLGKTTARFALRSAKIAKGMYEGGRAANRQYNANFATKSEKSVPPAAENPIYPNVNTSSNSMVAESTPESNQDKPETADEKPREPAAPETPSESSTKNFDAGDSVTVRRTSGEIESNWNVFDEPWTGKDGKTWINVRSWNNDGSRLSKSMPIEELEAMQPKPPEDDNTLSGNIEQSPAPPQAKDNVIDFADARDKLRAKKKPTPNSSEAVA